MIPESFHFLRPAWLLGAALVVPLVWLGWRQARSAGAWRQVCDPGLLSHLLVDGGGSAARWPLALLAIAWISGSVALAGPTWEQLPQPAFKEPMQTLLVLGLTDSMHQRDVAPSRLVRARYELRDALARIDGTAGLVIFSDEPYAVTPLTDDPRVIAKQVPLLEPALMPGRGDRVDRAIDEARTLLERAGAFRGRIVLLIDGVGDRPGLARSAASRAADAGYPVSVLGIGGDAGSMRALADAGGGRFAPISADDRDLDAVLAETSGPELGATAVASDLTADVWRDMGVWLVLVPLFLAPFAFRKGWAAALALPLLLGVGLEAPTAEAAITDWWLRSDQQAARAFEEGDHAQAAELFENEAWRGAAQYRAGDYTGAIESLHDAGDLEAQYNLGNALAHSQQYEQAIAAYDRVLEAEPDHADALHNKELVEKLLEQQQEQENQQCDSGEPSQEGEAQDDQQQDASQQAQDEAQQSEDEQDGKQGEDSPNDPSEQAARGAEDPDSEADATQDQASAGAEGDPEDAQEQAASGEAAQEDPQSEPREQAQAEPLDTQPADGEPQGNPQPGSASRREYSERDQEMEQRLNRVPDDPGGLLREKLRRRYLERRYGQAGGLR